MSIFIVRPYNNLTECLFSDKVIKKVLLNLRTIKVYTLFRGFFKDILVSRLGGRRRLSLGNLIAFSAHIKSLLSGDLGEL
ncbi:MAG: hypothetical protein COT67_02945 [Candidatus Tagabacteria bacterium CG09_land_8_20_14_0_10_41_14]|uniref:Uncharacterized protein n=1 Tax=Candidatus Tagabacteria bacterium CG09_land_8_20_14_0_10_41_14 TaxID=1975021 RepID=A0A2H0WKX5_9BACT|nr:MAG: hypothetical protein COT67_02945 [Candidatus Tagabacteria bacterium CG09_land_8_20_14_0_10_41_14]